MNNKSENINSILNQIFNPHLFGDNNSFKESYKLPSFFEIKTFAKLLADKSTEEAIQKFLDNHPHFLFRSVPTSGDSCLGLLIKPQIGLSYKADYAILSAGQGGCGITLIEIEKSSHSLFTKKLTPSKHFQSALGQIDDWNQWINSNSLFFSKSMLDLLKKSQYKPDKLNGKSFRYLSPNKIENAWNSFGGNEVVHVHSHIVIGRWGLLSAQERKRLIYINNSKRANFKSIQTYDQMIRMAIEGPQMIW